MADFDRAYRELGNQATSENTSCREFTKVLVDLGFDLESCGSAGHKIAKHPAIHVLEYPNFNCGHSQGDKVHRQYIKNLYRFVTNHREEIKEYLS